MVLAFFGKTELNRMREFGSGIYMIRADFGCTLAVMAITGHNQNASGSDPACLLECYKLDPAAPHALKVLQVISMISKRVLTSARENRKTHDDDHYYSPVYHSRFQEK